MLLTASQTKMLSLQSTATVDAAITVYAHTVAFVKVTHRYLTSDSAYAFYGRVQTKAVQGLRIVKAVAELIYLAAAIAYFWGKEYFGDPAARPPIIGEIVKPIPVVDVQPQTVKKARKPRSTAKKVETPVTEPVTVVEPKPARKSRSKKNPAT